MLGDWVCISYFARFSGAAVFSLWPLPHQAPMDVFTKLVPLFNFRVMLLQRPA